MWLNVAFAFAFLVLGGRGVSLLHRAAPAVVVSSTAAAVAATSVSSSTNASKRQAIITPLLRRRLLDKKGHLVSQELRSSTGVRSNCTKGNVSLRSVPTTGADAGADCTAAQTRAQIAQMAGLLTCGSTLDSFVLADVSGSVGETGILGTKVFLTRLLLQMQLGKSSSHQLMGLIEVGATSKLLSHLTDSQETFMEGASKLKFKGVAPDLSQALAYADTGFLAGRSDAHSLVLAIVDGPVIKQRQAVQMARHISQYADLVVILVASRFDAQADTAVREWLQAAGSCYGHTCRLIQVEDYEALAAVDITAVVAEICPNLV